MLSLCCIENKQLTVDSLPRVNSVTFSRYYYIMKHISIHRSKFFWIIFLLNVWQKMYFPMRTCVLSLHRHFDCPVHSYIKKKYINAKNSRNFWSYQTFLSESLQSSEKCLLVVCLCRMSAMCNLFKFTLTFDLEVSFWKSPKPDFALLFVPLITFQQQRETITLTECGLMSNISHMYTIYLCNIFFSYFDAFHKKEKTKQNMFLTQDWHLGPRAVYGGFKSLAKGPSWLYTSSQAVAQVNYWGTFMLCFPSIIQVT